MTKYATIRHGAALNALRIVFVNPPEPPGDFHWDRSGANTGGAGVDGALKRFFYIQMTYGRDRRTEDHYAHSRLFPYNGQTLALERDIADMLATATRIQIEE